MTRRAFFAGVIGSGSLASPREETFYITGGNLTTAGAPRDDCRVPALMAKGRDKAEALASSGLKVWSSLEYMRFEDRPDGKPCK